MAKLNIQYGAGWMAASGWLNFDASPTIMIERLPLVGRFIRVNEKPFPDEIRFGDIVKGLPVPEQSAKAVYASHVLEHLSYDDFWIALRNTYKILAPGGVFRLIVPDLQARARLYVDGVAKNDAKAASRFMESCCLGRRASPRGLAARLRAAFGHSDHLWMWDEPSLAAALIEAGFADVRRCAFGDAADGDFAAVEEADRFFDTLLAIPEIALEARRPAA